MKLSSQAKKIAETLGTIAGMVWVWIIMDVLFPKPSVTTLVILTVIIVGVMVSIVLYVRFSKPKEIQKS